MDKEVKIVKKGSQNRKYKMFTCVYCGKEFESRDDSKAKFCSYECMGLSRRKQEKGHKHICKQCGKEYRANHKESSFCSKKCQYQFFSGSNSHLYAGGTWISVGGYEQKYNNSKAKKSHYDTTHRKLVEDYIGKKLPFNEQVHHINEDKLDNRLDNLAILTCSEHASIHHYLRGNGHMTEAEYQAIIERGKERIRVVNELL